ncbi:hypothetical protein Egran_04838 [Elaphomyces granulatus]|uniref:MARVEL domain-containing protein n=1 Tax=Elaphomyces granulatus TaxID=519963 RepID=A0A232LT87_9EURO|nr:hypothetical protein Egran_04838 [Elaphomyces granulatus]
MIEKVSFIFWRVMEIIFLIPIIGIMAYFVNGFITNNQLTPDYILILFIVSVIAIFWAFYTLITKQSHAFVSLIDFGFFGALIAGIYKLNFISNADCTNWNVGSVLLSLGPFGIQAGYLRPDINKTCGMLKACFAIGIMEVIFFFFTAIAAIYMHRGHRDVVVKETFVRRSHSSRRGHGSHHSRDRRGSSSRRSYA